MNAKYRRSLKGHLGQAFHHMTQRVQGKSNRPHLYHGLSICTKEEFMEWSSVDPMYLMLHKAWTEADYDRKLTPSVDRKDSTKGYELDNLRWITASQNFRLGSLNALQKRKENKIA